MIRFDLKCRHDHRFDAWFRDSATFDSQAGSGEVPCPICGDTGVTKALMAPNIATAADRQKSAAADPQLQALVEKAHTALRELRQHVEANHENVGRRFPEEARKIHNGEVEPRGIYGEASLEDAKELVEDGIEILPLGPGRTDA